MALAKTTAANCLLGVLFCFGVAATVRVGGTNTPLFSERFERGLTGRWERLRFGRATDDSIVRAGPNHWLKVVADHTCSALMTKVDIPPSVWRMPHWQWKIDQVPNNSTDRIAGRFDHTARIIIAFDTFFGPPRTMKPLGEIYRQLCLGNSIGF